MNGLPIKVEELEPVLDAMLEFGFRPPPIGLARPFQGLCAKQNVIYAVEWS